MSTRSGQDSDEPWPPRRSTHTGVDGFNLALSGLEQLGHFSMNEHMARQRGLDTVASKFQKLFAPSLMVITLTAKLKVDSTTGNDVEDA